MSDDATRVRLRGLRPDANSTSGVAPAYEIPDGNTPAPMTEAVVAYTSLLDRLHTAEALAEVRRVEMESIYAALRAILDRNAATDNGNTYWDLLQWLQEHAAPQEATND